MKYLVFGVGLYRWGNLLRTKKILVSVIIAAVITGSAYGVFNYLKKQNQKIDNYKPRIDDLRYEDKIYLKNCKPGVQNVNYTATDIIDAKNHTGPIDSARVEIIHNPSGNVVLNKTSVPLGNNVYRSLANITKEGAHEVRVIVKDPPGNVKIESRQFEAINKSWTDEFVKHYVNKGYNELIVKSLPSKMPKIVEMFPEVDLRDDVEEIVKLANNSGVLPIDKNPVGVISTAIYSDSDVKYPEMLIANVSRAFNAFKKYSLIKQDSWFFGNLTKYKNQYILPIYGKDALNLGICVISEDPEINKNFTSRQHHIFCLLMKYNPEISNHTLGVKAGTLQVDCIVYGRGMDEVKGEEYVWLRVIQPRVAHVVQREDSGKINCLDYGDFEAEREFDDPELEMKTARVALFPIDFTEIYIKTGIRLIGPGPFRRLEIAEANANYDEELGEDPQKWLANFIDQVLKERGKIYEDAMEGARYSHPNSEWPNSRDAYRDEFDIIKQEDPEACVIIGLPYALRINYILEKLTEQTNPHYAVLVGSERGRYVCVRIADYPQSPPDKIFTHDEAHVIVRRTSDGWFKPHLFGFYLKKKPFIDDYEGSQIEPYIEERDIDGNRNPIPLN